MTLPLLHRPRNVMLNRDLSLEFSHFCLVVEARPRVQHSMRRNLPILCLKLQRRGFGITRIIRQVPFGAHSCCIRSYDQAMFATEYIGFMTRMRKSDVRQAREEGYVSKKSGTRVSVIQTPGGIGRSPSVSG